MGLIGLAQSFPGARASLYNESPPSFATSNNPRLAYDSRVRFIPGLVSSGYNRQGFRLQGSFRRTTTSSGFKMDFFQIFVILSSIDQLLSLSGRPLAKAFMCVWWDCLSLTETCGNFARTPFQPRANSGNRSALFWLAGRLLLQCTGFAYQAATPCARTAGACTALPGASCYFQFRLGSFPQTVWFSVLIRSVVLSISDCAALAIGRLWLIWLET